MLLLVFSACDDDDCCDGERITTLSQLEGKTFAVADELVRSMFPDASFAYDANALAACLAVRARRVVDALRAGGEYEEMVRRWLPEEGAPVPQPLPPLEGDNGTLRFGTAAVTEPFSYIDDQGNIVGFDIELAWRVALELGMRLEVVNMAFAEMIPELTQDQVDMIGACITITPDRSLLVLFSEPYYTGGIAALVRE